MDVRLSGSSNRFGIPSGNIGELPGQCDSCGAAGITNWAVPEIINAAYDDGGGQLEFILNQ